MVIFVEVDHATMNIACFRCAHFYSFLINQTSLAWFQVYSELTYPFYIHHSYVFRTFKGRVGFTIDVYVYKDNDVFTSLSILMLNNATQFVFWLKISPVEQKQHEKHENDHWRLLFHLKFFWKCMFFICQNCISIVTLIFARTSRTPWSCGLSRQP